MFRDSPSVPKSQSKITTIRCAVSQKTADPIRFAAEAREVVVQSRYPRSQQHCTSSRNVVTTTCSERRYWLASRNCDDLASVCSSAQLNEVIVCQCGYPSWWVLGGKKKILCSCQEFNPPSFTLYPVTTLRVRQRIFFLPFRSICSSRNRPSPLM